MFNHRRIANTLTSVVTAFPRFACVPTPTTRLSRALGRFVVAAVMAGVIVSPPAARAGSFATLHQFTGTPDGQGPFAGLIYLAGSVYGTTGDGGTANNRGTVFKLNLSTGQETVLHSFGGSPDGELPESRLLYHAATLYGTTYYGGAHGGAVGYGTVFELNLHSAAERVLYSFAGGTDGANPVAGVIYHAGDLYGTTTGGGASGYGTVFKVNPATGAESVIYGFAGGTDGASPFAGLIYHAGDLYGTTSGGGASGYGTVFKVDPATGTETVLYSFAGGRDGATPLGDLIAHDGKVFGTTNAGGGRRCVFAKGCGTVFQFDLATGRETVLHGFKGAADGAYPMDGLLYQGGILYGVTYGHDTGSDTGTFFEVNSGSGSETVLHRFTGTSDGALPMSVPLYQAGSFYGTASNGGRADCGGSGCGTVFRFTP